MKKHLKSLACVVAGVGAAAGAASATVHVFTSTTMSGAQESPSVVSNGTGTGVFTYDDVAHTLRMQVTFSGLTGNTTLAHIHAPTAVGFVGNAGVSVQPPSLLNFPLGVTSGSYDQTFNLRDSATYSGAFVTNNGGTLETAETALIGFMSTGRAYFNIHTSFVGSGEIRGYIPAPGAAGLLCVGGLIAMRRRRTA